MAQIRPKGGSAVGNVCRTTLSFGIKQESTEAAGVNMVSKWQKQGISKFKAIRKLLKELKNAVNKLYENRRSLSGRAGSMRTSLSKFVAKRKPLFFDQN